MTVEVPFNQPILDSLAEKFGAGNLVYLRVMLPASHSLATAQLIATVYHALAVKPPEKQSVSYSRMKNGWAVLTSRQLIDDHEESLNLFHHQFGCELTYRLFDDVMETS